MERATLSVQSREIRGKKVKQLRLESWIPAVMYGPDSEPAIIQAEERSLVSVIQSAGSTALIDLTIDNGAKPYVVLAREIQREILTGRVTHVDFYEVRLTEKVKTSPRLVFVGEAPAAKAAIAVVLNAMNEIEVECLPTDLINSIEVDISGLEKMDDTITVADLNVPSSVTITVDPTEVVVSLVPVRVILEDEEEEFEVELEGEEVVAEGEEEPEEE